MYDDYTWIIVTTPPPTPFGTAPGGGFHQLWTFLRIDTPALGVGTPLQTAMLRRLPRAG